MFPPQKNFMCFLNRATEKQNLFFLLLMAKSAKIGQSQNYALLETCELKNLLALFLIKSIFAFPDERYKCKKNIAMLVGLCQGNGNLLS